MNLHELAAFRLVYLASPYTRYKPGLDQASEDVCEVAGRLIARGVRVFCPIAHAHAIAMSSGIDPVDHVLWLGLDEVIAPACQALVVVELDGWDKSDGVAKEIEWFADRPIFYLDPKTMNLRTSP
jgi:hypothetical protein